MPVDDRGHIKIRSLIISGRVFIAELHHSASAIVAALVPVHSESKSLAFHIYGLTRLIVIVQSCLSYLYLDSSGLVLDVEAPVEISGTVRRRDLAGNHNVILYDLRLTELIHSHKLGYRMGRRHLDFLIFARLRIFSRKDRSELIAGSDRHKGQHRCSYLI